MANESTGHGATIAFSGGANNGFTSSIRRIGEVDFSLPNVDKSHLGTTGFRELIPGDLEEISPLEVMFLFNADLAIPVRGGTPDTVTITFPNVGSGGATEATLAGTGYISALRMPALETNVLMEAMMTVQFDGGTGPTFTPEAP